MSRNRSVYLGKLKQRFQESESENYLLLLVRGLSDLDKNELKKLFLFFKKNTKYHFLIGKCRFLNQSNLGNLTAISNDDYNVQNLILWSQWVLEENSGTIASYISKKMSFEENYLIGNFEGCQKCLDEIEKELGYSWWLVEAKVAFLLRFKGSAEKARYVNELIDSNQNDDASLFSFILEKISKRNDEKTQLSGFRKQINTLLLGTDIPEVIKQYLYFKLFKKIDMKYSAQIVISDSITNPVDLYDNLCVVVNKIWPQF